MHARVFTYGLERRDEGTPPTLRDLGAAMSRQPGYRGRIVIAAAGNRLIDWHFHDTHEAAIRAWAVVLDTLTCPRLTAALRLVGEGAVAASDRRGLGLPRPVGRYARVAAPHYPPDDLPDVAGWVAILRSQPGYCGWLMAEAGYGRLLTLTVYDTADSYTAARDCPAAQRHIATHLAPRWTAPTQQVGAGTVLLADLRE